MGVNALDLYYFYICEEYVFLLSLLLNVDYAVFGGEG
jgi:hypothetical protein